MPSASMSIGYAPVTFARSVTALATRAKRRLPPVGLSLRNSADGARTAGDIHVGPAVRIAVEHGDASADVERVVAAVNGVVDAGCRRLVHEPRRDDGR